MPKDGLVVLLLLSTCVPEKEEGSLAWARYDSRPLLKAKEPRGRAESARRRRKCVVGFRYERVAVRG